MRNLRSRLELFSTEPSCGLDMNDLPNCVCDRNDYRHGSSSLSRIHTQWQICNACDRQLLLLSAYGTHYQIFFPADKSAHQAALEWLNMTVMIVGRAFQERRRVAKDLLWEEFLPDFCRRSGMVWDKDNYWEGDFPSPEFRQECQDFEARTLGQSLEDSPVLPCPPSDVRIWRYVGSEYVIQQPEESLGLEVPRDPVVVKNEQFWKRVFDEVGVQVYEDAENTYSENGKPWYSFRHGDGVFTVGWRHRVVSIEGVFPSKKDLSAVRQLGERDSVTCNVEDNQFTIHAWSEDHCVEYMQKILAAI